MDQNNEQLNTTTTSEVNTDFNEATVAKRRRSKFWDILLWVLIIVLAITLFVRVFVVSRVTVSGESMMETFHDKQTVTVNKLSKPKRGDVVVFYKNPVKNKFLALFARGGSTEQDGEYYKLIKRVVALGGDKLWLEHIEDNQYRLVVQTQDGNVLHEDYYKHNKETLNADGFILFDKKLSGLGCLKGTTQDNPLVIEDGYFFALGDNRANSDDSRGDLGQVPLSQLFGVVV